METNLEGVWLKGNRELVARRAAISLAWGTLCEQYSSRGAYAHTITANQTVHMQCTGAEIL